MAIIRVQNLTQYILSIPVLTFLLPPYEVKDGNIVDIDEFYNDTRIQGLMEHPSKITVTLIQDSTPGAQGDAILPFLPVSGLPDAASNPGMMVFNTTNHIVLYSDSTSWVAVENIPSYNSAPVPSSLPAGYLIWEKNTQSLLYNGGSAWMRTTANGIRSLPSHLFPAAAIVPVGTLMFDSDNEQMKLSDGTNWQLTNNVNDYGMPVNLPALGDVGFGALAYTSRDATLWTRYSTEWKPTTGILRFYATFGDLPIVWGNDERGAIAYINDDRTVVVWDGKYWRYPVQMPDYKTSDIPSAANYSDGHMILNGDHIQPLIAWAGNWRGATAVASGYVALSRPANTDVPEGTMIWNTTSNQANWNIGGNWVDATGTPDP